MTFLALDIGNTRLKWALYASPHPDAELLSQGAEFLENIDKIPPLCLFKIKIRQRQAKAKLLLMEL